jgi:cytochrome b subunit of formate dehydrogenase
MIFSRSLLIRFAVLALWLLGAPPAGTAPAPAGPINCYQCHEKTVHAQAYGQSSHKDLACTACHQIQAMNVPSPAGKKACIATYAKMDCARCHKQEAAEFQKSVHNGARLPVDCAKCHTRIHELTSKKEDKLASAQICTTCHKRQLDYYDSIHYEMLKKGRKDPPTCTDCHNRHAIAKVDNDAKGRDFHTRACLRCHDDKPMMQRNQVTPIATDTFFDGFHGKNVRLEFPEKVAGCADCHGSHAVRKASDPKSTVNAAGLVKTCRQCHPSAGVLFTRYLPHAEDHNRKKSPALYWTRVSMTALLVGTFVFFWIHSLLWALRSFIDRQAAANQALSGQAPAHGAASRKVYRRFRTKHIVMHLVVVTSFLALALTGLPLKFAGMGWGKLLLNGLGGPERARFIHHSAAVVTFGYFATALWMSVRFLFARPDGIRGALGRLLGPDSLFPSLRDWRDLKAMFRWFFFAGPKPTFERWTYWEKFDFMAVFWGMFAIGLSGLMLWFPSLFSRLLPGWVFNVATIIHSDEALLATGFIFTVHFFNTHFRPEKFPMDTVIFNGRVSHEEMLEERGDQLKRYEAEGRLHEFEEAQPTSVAWEFASRLFGFFAVAVGLALAAFMTYTLIR